MTLVLTCAHANRVCRNISALGGRARGISWAKPLSSISTMGLPLSLISLDLLLKDTPFVVVRFRMLQGFFICHPQFTKRLPDGPFVSPQNRHRDIGAHLLPDSQNMATKVNHQLYYIIAVLLYLDQHEPIII